MSEETEPSAAIAVADEAEDVAAEPEKKPKKVKPPKAPKVHKAKKKGGFNMLLVFIPVGLIAAIVLAITLPPTHAILANGPLKPLFARFDKTSTAKGVAKGKKADDPAADVKHLSDTVESDRKAAQAKDAQIAQLQAQVTQLQAPPESSPTPAAKPTPVVISDDVKRAATYWSGMDADKAAEIVKQLPEAYVKQVFSQMPADAVSDIMSALPAKTAARLTTDAGADTP